MNNPFAGDIALPETYEQTIHSKYVKQWKKALAKEVQLLRDKKVFRLVKRSSLPKGANVISGKWVFKVKPNEDGSIERFKCRLCVRGFLQKYGIDYMSTFSPVTNPVSLKLMSDTILPSACCLDCTEVSLRSCCVGVKRALDTVREIVADPDPLGIDHRTELSILLEFVEFLDCTVLVCVTFMTW